MVINNMKFKNKISGIGILLYLVLMLVDRTMYKIPDIIYVSITIVLMIVILIGFILDSKKTR